MLLLAALGLAHAAPAHEPHALPEAVGLAGAFHAAAGEHGVPVVLLQALAWEASHWQAHPDSAFGHGPLVLRDEGAPSIEEASILLGVSPDLLIDEPGWNLRGGAALLADQARRANGGALPDVDDLESWWAATRVFSGSEDPYRQQAFALQLQRFIAEGVDDVVASGERVAFGGVPIGAPDLAGPIAPRLPVGDYAGSAAFTEACDENYTEDNRGPGDIEYIVIHTVQGSYSSAINWFANCSASVSAHYVVRSSDGQITQTLREEDIGWHAGNWTYNELSVGIEHEGYVDEPSYLTDALYRESAALTADICARNGFACNRNQVIGHDEVPGATHTDPGDYWDWDYYMSLVTGSHVVTADLTGVVAAEDIFTGERIEGARVWLEGTGEQTTTDSTGTWRFDDLPTGSYTVHATAPGYAEGTCEKDLDSSILYWCSIALFPGTSDTEEPDPDPDDTDVGPGPRDLAWDRLRKTEAGGCDHSGVAGAWLVIFAAAAWTRRRG